jgi:hypothetical protein
MPTTGIQPAATAPSAIVPNRKEPPAAGWIHVAASLLLPGTFTRDVSFPTKETLLYISELVGSGSSS